MNTISLKHIPCPAGQACHAFKCIFGHEGEEQTRPPSPPSKRQRSEDNTITSNPEKSRKRAKLEEEISEKPLVGEKLSVRDDSEQSISKPQIADGASTPHRASKPRPQASNFKLTVKKPSTSASGAITSDRRLEQKPRKAESLNPRLLKNAPASHSTRVKLLKMLHQEYSRLNLELKKDEAAQELVLSEQELILKTLDDEQKIALEKPAVYSNVMKNKIIQHKRLNVTQWKTQLQDETKLAWSQLQSNDDSSAELQEIITGLTPTQEVQLLQHILTPIDSLSNHGYVPAPPSEDSVQEARRAMTANKSWQKCDRCQQRFQVFPGRREEDGTLATGGRCEYHWGRTYVAQKVPWESGVVKRRRCCNEEVGETAGCQSSDHHVFKLTDPAAMATVLNFEKTPENILAPNDRAVCFDCEMGYTVYGLELIRLTATSWPTGDVLLDVLVQPLGEILDLNSRFSGVWPDDLALAEPWIPGDKTVPTPQPSPERKGVRVSVKTLKKVSSPQVARDLFFSLISPTTTLIGHGLENDLNAIRIIHPTLIDTVLLYPHKAGLPLRHGLKQLMEIRLNLKIQQETGSKIVGHDSAEDARAAGELVRLKVKNQWNDFKRLGWKFRDGEFISPDELKAIINKSKRT